MGVWGSYSGLVSSPEERGSGPIKWSNITHNITHITHTYSVLQWGSACNKKHKRMTLESMGNMM